MNGCREAKERAQHCSVTGGRQIGEYVRRNPSHLGTSQRLKRGHRRIDTIVRRYHRKTYNSTRGSAGVKHRNGGAESLDLDNFTVIIGV